MAINLALKYSDKIAEKFKASSFVAGNTSNEYEFNGVKSLRVTTPQTVALNDYSRTGTSNRFGTPAEMQDVVQEMSMTQDKSFSLVIDKGNNTDQMLVKNAGKMLKLQIDEQVVPTVDKRYFTVLLKDAGSVVNVSSPSKSTICGLIDDGVQVLDDALVPQVDRILYITAANYKLLKQSDEFTKADDLVKSTVIKGLVGEYNNMNVVKVPSSYFPTGMQFAIVYKNATLLPYKIQDAKIHQDPPGFSGALLEGRNYFDAFVLGTKSSGVYVATTATKQATPTGAGGSGSITLTSANASTIKYTLDGSDPRYSLTALTASTGVAITVAAATYTVKAVAYHATNATSDVYSASLTAS